ncbi:MAG: prepilin-type N-terminal cleavage/methylation domain-containing protein [Candidatus Muiribacteriota bacterium]|jgi:prepilin-type N-terminal cleavage/methylation domain-containing protein
MLNNKALTLLEILIVVLILGIIVTFAVTSFTGSRLEAQRVRVMADLEELRKAFGTYAIMDSQSKYPTSIYSLITAGLIKEVPRDPWKSNYELQIRNISTPSGPKPVIFIGSYHKDTIEIQVGFYE